MTLNEIFANTKKNANGNITINGKWARDFEKFEASVKEILCVKRLTDDQYNSIEAKWKELQSSVVEKEEKHLMNSTDLNDFLDSIDCDYEFGDDEEWHIKNCKYGADTIAEKDVINHIFTHFRNIGIAGGTKDAIDTMLSDAKVHINTKKRFDEFEAVEYDDDCVAYLDNALKTIYNYFEVKEDYDVYECVMKHWMHNVKVSALTNEQRENHLWINFIGITGCGKSRFLDLLIAPLSRSYSKAPNISSVLDTEKNGALFSKPILRFDELGVKSGTADVADKGLRADDIDVLKDMISCDRFQQRTYHTQDMPWVRNRANFISCSNRHLYDVIYDETSMRRYFELTFTCGKKTKKDFPIINAIDFVKMWKGIDESETYFDNENETGCKIIAIQNSYVQIPNSMIEYGTAMARNIEASELDEDFSTEYAHYDDFCKTSKLCACSQPRFKEIIKKAGVKCCISFARMDESLVKKLNNYWNANKDDKFKRHARLVATEGMKAFKRQYGQKAFEIATMPF